MKTYFTNKQCRFCKGEASIYRVGPGGFEFLCSSRFCNDRSLTIHRGESAKTFMEDRKKENLRVGAC